ncbi:MAG: isoleucine--tRNA ligase [archaeon]
MYDFKATEEEVLKFWENSKIYDKIKKRNSKGKPYYFLQGPPYTSGYLHLGQAWNNGMKDMVLRYKRMHGFDVWDRGGFDMHGLPTARKVMAELKLNSKEEIEHYGVEKFVNKCMEYGLDKVNVMNKDLWRLGVWMDHKNAYMPITTEYIEAIWWLIKKADEKKRLYEGMRTLSWCASCQTAMAKHECEYKVLEEDSIFLKFKLKGKKNEYLVIWTTTPWTIAYNMGIMVHPELEYVKVKMGDEYWVVAKGLVGPFVQTLLGKKLEVVETFVGEDMKGWEYDHPWKKDIKQFDEMKKSNPKTHTVVLSSEYVSLKGGSGLVHMAGGCGPEDYEVSHDNDIPSFNNLNEDGTFPEKMGRFAGLRAKKDDKKFIEIMKKDGFLIEVTEVEHDYAHCQRCHEPVIFRTTKQWFFKVEDLKEKMIKENSKVHWVPEEAGNAFHSWLDNLRDNSITKQRYWGTPAPIWRCKECGEYIVVGSVKELEQYAKAPKNLHKPWIDNVKWDCKCGGKYERIPDILDVWIDAGVGSWACLDYPHRKDLFEKYFPIDFIIEGKDQIRGWFNLLMIASMITMDKNCFKNVYMHGFVTDVGGEKMSKSIGNVISPYELIDKHGADTLRFYMTSNNAGEDINFSWEEAKLRYKNLSILWNVHNYLLDYSKVFKPKISKLDLVDKYIISKMNSTLLKVTEHMEKYEIDKIPKLIEDLFLDLSRNYIQLTRDRTDENVLGVIEKVLLNSVKILSILCPFISEKIYLDMKTEFKYKEDSVHMLEWPKFDKKDINLSLEKDFDVAFNVISSILAARERAGIGVRWPLRKVSVVSQDKDVSKSVKKLKDLILSQTNIREIEILDKMEGVQLEITMNRNAIGRDFKRDSKEIMAGLSDAKLKKLVNDGKLKIGKFNLDMSHVLVKEDIPEGVVGSAFTKGSVYLNTAKDEELEKEGFAREVVRVIQSMRKDAGLVKKDRIKLSIKSDYDLSKLKKDIIEKVGATGLIFEEKKYKDSKEFKIKEKGFIVSFEKV